MAPKGEKVDVVVNPSRLMLGQAVEARLKEFLYDQGLEASQIAILAPQRQMNTCISKLKSINKLLLSDDLDSWRSGRSILSTTIRAFKGLEADVVLLLLTDQPRAESIFTIPDYYVACSRAKHHLIIFSEHELEQ